MKFFTSISIAILTGALALCCAGIVASACTEWYNVSSFEGKAGFIVVGIALLGGLAGLVIGFAVAWIVASEVSPWFFKGLGLSCGIVLALSALATLFSWVMADFPPKIDGDELYLLVEYRMPAEETELPEPSRDTSVILTSKDSWGVRRVEWNELELDEARHEEGRWILPGGVFLFSSRKERFLYMQIAGETRADCLVPLPRKPGLAYEQWSDWLPLPDLQGQDNIISYRIRVQRIEPSPPPPDPEIKIAEEFAALDQASPLIEWLKYVEYDQPPERINTAMKMIETRQEELALAIRSDDSAERTSALLATTRLSQIMPAVSAAVLEDGREIEAAIRRFNEMMPDDPNSLSVQVELRSRFSNWHRAWWNVHQRTDIDARPPVQNILDLALIRAKETSMDEIVINARAHLDGIK